MAARDSNAELPFLRDALPALYTELRSSLVQMGENELALQLDDAQVHAFCDCSEIACRSFYLSMPRAGPCEGDYRVVTPPAVLTVGVCDGTIDYVGDHALGGSSDEARRTEWNDLREVVPGAPP